jgi:hypothetical protein
MAYGKIQFEPVFILCTVLVHIILPAAHGPGVDSASNRNEYQEYFTGIKKAGA